MFFIENGELKYIYPEIIQDQSFNFIEIPQRVIPDDINLIMYKLDYDFETKKPILIPTDLNTTYYNPVIIDIVTKTNYLLKIKNGTLFLSIINDKTQETDTIFFGSSQIVLGSFIKIFARLSFLNPVLEIRKGNLDSKLIQKINGYLVREDIPNFYCFEVLIGELGEISEFSEIWQDGFHLFLIRYPLTSNFLSLNIELIREEDNNSKKTDISVIKKLIEEGNSFTNEIKENTNNVETKIII